VEVGTVITLLTVDGALQHICAVFREQAVRGEITPTERDLLIDGAVLLAMRVDDLDRDSRVDSNFGWPEGTQPQPVGRPNAQSERYPGIVSGRPNRGGRLLSRNRVTPAMRSPARVSMISPSARAGAAARAGTPAT